MTYIDQMTPSERRAYYAEKARAFYRSESGRRYQKKIRARLFNPEWELSAGPRKWSAAEDAAILAREKPDRELARQFGVTIPALRQRRIRAKRLPHTAALYRKVSDRQYARIKEIQGIIKDIENIFSPHEKTDQKESDNA